MQDQTKRPNYFHSKERGPTVFVLYFTWGSICQVHDSSGPFVKRYFSQGQSLVKQAQGKLCMLFNSFHCGKPFLNNSGELARRVGLPRGGIFACVYLICIVSPTTSHIPLPMLADWEGEL